MSRIPLSNGSYAEPVAVANPNGSTVTRNTTAVSGSFQAILILEEANFSAFTATGLTGSLTGFAIPAGTMLFGLGTITGYTLASGSVQAYND